MRSASLVKLLLLVLLIVVTVTACRKNLDNISTSQWQPELAAPFINSDITLRNIIGNDTNLITTPDSLLVYYYTEDSVMKLTADSVLKPPEEINFENRYTLGEIAVSDEIFNDSLTLNEMLDNIDEQVADSLRAFDGEVHIFPPFQLEEPVRDTFRASNEYAYLTFSNGHIDLGVTNTLPVTAQNVIMKLVDLDYNQDLKIFNISEIKPGETFQDSVILDNKTIGNEFLMELTQFETTGSFPDQVLIDLQQGLALTLMIDDAKVISGLGKVTEQIIISTTEMIAYQPEEEEKLFHIEFSEGDLQYRFESGLNVNSFIEIQFPSALVDGEIPATEFLLAKGGTELDQASAAGMSIDFTTDTAQPYNRFPVDFKITLQPTDEWVQIDSSDNVDAFITFNEIGLFYADGYLGKKEVNVTRDTVETGLDWLGDLEGEITLTEPVVEISYRNGMGIPLKVLPEIFGYNTTSGESQGLGSDTITIDYPEQPGNAAQGSFEYNNVNSTLVELIAIRPDMVIYDGEGFINWNEPDLNFVYDTSIFYGNAEVRIPLVMKSSYFSFNDTAKINVDEADNSIKEGLMIANVLNGFPFEMHLQLLIPDSITGEILETVDFGMMESALVDEEGKVIEPVAGELTGALDEDFLTSLTRASYALINVESSTFDDGAKPVALHADYTLKTAIGFQVKIQP